MITADEVQFAYPNPTNPIGQGYCVGGALMLATGNATNQNHCFPTRLQLTLALQLANPLLGEADARTFANRIVQKNDAELFDSAWLALREALKWEPEA